MYKEIKFITNFVLLFYIIKTCSLYIVLKHFFRTAWKGKDVIWSSRRQARTTDVQGT